MVKSLIVDRSERLLQHVKESLDRYNPRGDDSFPIHASGQLFRDIVFIVPRIQQPVSSLVSIIFVGLFLLFSL